MIWLIFSILTFVASLLLAAFIFFANGMSDSPNAAFQGGWLIVPGFVVSGALLLIYFFG